MPSSYLLVSHYILKVEQATRVRTALESLQRYRGKTTGSHLPHVPAGVSLSTVGFEGLVIDTKESIKGKGLE